ncbi:MAG: MBL fold metallo-hydrolase, partial [Polyangiaceae bacterium]
MTIYKNLDGTTPDKGLGSILKWQLVDRMTGKRTRAPDHFDTPRRDPDLALLQSSEPSLTWIGHATFAMRLGKKMIATDPIW